MATIQSYELKNGQKRYMFQLYIGVDPLTGKEQRTTRRGFKTKKEAELTLARLKLEIDKGNYKKESPETFQEVYELWLDQYKKNKVSESTLVKVTRVYRKHIIPAFGQYRIDKITVEVCQKHVNDWFDKFDDYLTIRRYTSRIIDFAIKRGYTKSNPMKLVELPSRRIELSDDEESNEKFYDRTQLIEFLNCLEKEKNYKAYTMMRLLAFSGMRRGEALALTWNDINFKTNEIRINKTLSRGLKGRLLVKPPKTKKSIRTIEMDQKTMGILDEWKKRQKQEYFKLGYNTLKPDQLVFSNKYNEYLQLAIPQKWMLSVQKKYELEKISPHGLRHTHCSLMFEADATIKEVQERLGHNNINTTLNIYTHVTKKAKSEAIQKFANYINI
ncbi:site-specific integrase [Lysinibacillus sphaericus]|uniref:site-specific integrase n=1 Tax=Lysinibacillus sphaericus TaxID=1421 RepID=UPI001A9E628A|nr:site-specific integrase [Lysinibacillus sphaericus]QTB29061.1 site-specific integrase [Lysinibacillus sphaericus]